MTVRGQNDSVFYTDATGKERNAELVVTSSTSDYASGATPITASSGNVAAAVATAIVVSAPSLGAGNTNATMVAHGYRK